MKETNSNKDTNDVKDSIYQDIRSIIMDYAEANKPAKKKLSYEEFELVVINGAYKTAKFVLQIYDKDSSIISEHKARTYANSTPVTDGSMIQDMYNNYINNTCSYETCVGVAVDILTNIFCFKNGFPIPCKNFKVIRYIND